MRFHEDEPNDPTAKPCLKHRCQENGNSNWRQFYRTAYLSQKPAFHPLTSNDALSLACPFWVISGRSKSLPTMSAFLR